MQQVQIMFVISSSLLRLRTKGLGVGPPVLESDAADDRYTLQVLYAKCRRCSKQGEIIPRVACELVTHFCVSHHSAA